MRVLLAILLTTSIAAADSFECNANGAVVNLDNGNTYYLGKSCDAALKGGGEGRWFLAASAMVVEIEGEGLRLPIEVGCESLPACWSTSRD